MQQDPQQFPGMGQEARPRRRRGYRSLFWAVVIIAAGIVWLLFSADVLTGANARMLALLWPILIVGLGVDLLVGRRSLALGAMIGVVTVALIVVFMVIGPSLGWTESAKLITETRTVPLGQATSAGITIDSGPFSANVHALPASTSADRALLSGTISYTGSLSLEASGGTEKSVVLKTESRGWLSWFDSVDAPPWDIGLDPSTPIAFESHTSSGSVDLDLAGLVLTGVKVGVSSGKVSARLPAGGTAYATKLQLSSGDLDVQVAAGARMDMEVDISSGDATVSLGTDSDGTIDFQGSSGGFTLQLAAGQACRIEVRRVSSGDVHLPAGLVRVSEGNGKEGTWQTDGYDSAAHKVIVAISISSGDVRVQQ